MYQLEPRELSFMKKIIIYAVLFLVVLLFSAGCAVNPVTGKSQLMLVSEDQEVTMGKEFYPSALWGDMGGGGEYRDDRLRSYLKDIILRIHSVSHRPNLPIDFAIQNSSIPNAWAIPGHVTITRGLLAALDNEAEFAFVMGHEMGHVSARHSASQMSCGMLQQIGLGVAGIALSNSSLADPALTLGNIGGSLLLLKYSRDDELEADRLGVLYMTRLGYDPQYAVMAHNNLEKVAQDYQRLMGKDSQQGGVVSDLLSTHPRTSIRIDEIRQLIRNLPPYSVVSDGASGERFMSMSAQLRKTNQVYLYNYDKAVKAFSEDKLEEADSLISKAISAEAGQAPFHNLKGYIALKKKDYTGADQLFKSALNRDPNYEPAIRGMGTLLYYKQSYSDSTDYLKKALTLFPQDASAHYFLGMDYFRMASYKNAIPYLKAYADIQPKHPEVHGVLGICYESTDDRQSAYNEYLAQVKVAPSNDMGRYAQSRLGVLGSLSK